MFERLVGLAMLLIYFTLIGAAASQAVRLPGLLLIVSLLAVAIGLEGALSDHAFVATALDAVAMLMAVELAYFGALALGRRTAGFLSRWKA